MTLQVKTPPKEAGSFATLETAIPAVKQLDIAATEAWDQFVLGHPGATFFHLTGWKRVIEKTFGYKAQYVYCERDGKITGIAPLFDFSNWLVGHCLISTPLAAYGGIVAEDAASKQALLNHLKGFAQSTGVDYLELRQQEGDLSDGFCANTLYVTFRSPLSSDPQVNLKRLPKDTRYMIRKAEKGGLKIVFGDDNLPAFYDLFALSMKRLGTPAFPQALFRNCLEEFPQHTQLAIVYDGSKPVTGVLSFFFRDTILPYYAGATESATRLAANNFMYWQLIKWAGERGFQTFDFGRSKKNTGSYAFKSQWNMTIEPLSYQIFLVKRKTVPNFSPVNPSFDLAIRMWRNLPLPVTKLLGPRVVRLFP
jgi:FemAB-related protein (PEP-CTERM system-associated)